MNVVSWLQLSKYASKDNAPVMYVLKLAMMGSIHWRAGNAELKEQPEVLEISTKVYLIPLYYSSELKKK